MVFHVARGQFGSCNSLEFGKQILGALSDDVDKHIQPPAVCHSDDALLNTRVGRLSNNRLHGRNEGFPTLKTEAFLADIASVQKTFQTFCRSKPFENGALAGSGIGGSRATALKFFLPPALLHRVGDVHEFGADRTAISLAQGGKQRAQRHLIGTEIGVGGVKLGVEVGIGEPVEVGFELTNGRCFVAF